MFKLDAFRVHLIQSSLSSLGQSMIWTVMMLYQIEVVGLTPVELVLVGTTMETTVFLFEVPTGIVADVYSRRWSALIGFLMIAVSYVGQALIPTFASMIAANVIWGIGYTFTSGAYEAWLVDEIGEERLGIAFIRSGQLGRLMGIVGIIAGVIVGSISLQWAILIGAGLLGVMTLFLFFFMHETAFEPVPRGERSSWRQMVETFREGVAVLRSRPTLMSIFAIGIFIGLYSEGWDRLWQIHLIENIGLPQVEGLQPVFWFGMIDIVGMMIGIVSAEVLRRRVNMTNGFSLTRALLWCIVFMIAGLIGYAFASSFIMAMIALFLFSTMRGLTGPIFSTWSNMNIDSRVRATVLSMQAQTDAIGQIVGGPPLGAIGQLSLRAAFIGSAVILSPVIALLVPMMRQARQINVADEVT